MHEHAHRLPGRYIAIGDSFTEGLWDHDRDDPDQQRGWADRLAEILHSRRQGAGLAALEYANHAVRGWLLEPIITEQLPRALDQHPDLISIVGGGNDVLRPGSDPDELAALLDGAVARTRATGAGVLMATGMDTRGVALLGALRSKVGVYNAHIWSIADRHGAHVLDLWGLAALHDRRAWADDRIHLNPAGHERVAQAALAALGLEPDDPEWHRPFPNRTGQTAMARLREDAQWLRRDVYPWATRRLRRTSSGADREPKFPELFTLD